jgi:low affinity Fe/Cu permease
MVFLIQNSQNRDSAAIQVKLNELIRVSTVHNSFVGIENLTDEEIEELRTKCELRAKGRARRHDRPRTVAGISFSFSISSIWSF